MNKPEYLTVTEEGARLDLYLASSTDLSRSVASRLIDEGQVTVNGRLEKRKYTVKIGDLIGLSRPSPLPAEAKGEEIPLDIVYEDSDILVVNKPSGMVVHPAPGNYGGTLVNALIAHCGSELSGIGGAMRPGIVHRIDKDTGGLLVVAKNDIAHRELCRQMEGHHIRREYRALVQGNLPEDEGTIDLPIGRHPVKRKQMAVLREGEGRARNAVTHYRVLERFHGVSYLALTLETGRTHQIRVHLSHLHHPLLGDTLYGGGNTPFEKKHLSLFSGQTLHAVSLTFVHPRKKEEMSFTAPLPENFEKLLHILRETN